MALDSSVGPNKLKQHKKKHIGADDTMMKIGK